MRSLLAPMVCTAFLAVVVACSERTPAALSPPEGADAATETNQDASAGPATDAADAGNEALTPTKKTSADVTLGGVSRTLERAQFGLSKEDAGGETLYVEAHEGGVAACPEAETPKRTLIVSGVPVGTPGQSFTKSDGVAVSLVDFTGDQITSGNPLAKASAATVTIVAIDNNASVEIEVDATFDTGTAKGRIYATYCEAMSQ